MGSGEAIEIPKPRYNGTIVCPHCYAEYSPGNWCFAVNTANGTQTPDYNPIAKIPDDECPICREKQL
jgi:hypothetical protein